MTTANDDNNRPRCPREATLDQVRDNYHHLSEVRHGHVLRHSSYPNEQMRRLLESEAEVPRWRRLLRWLTRR